MEIKTYLNEKRETVNAFLKEYCNKPAPPSVLHDSMTYSLLAGGKRIRPILCLASYEACGGDGKDILPQACAIELIHTYSLIHDDLPSMDNDDLRRGKPTNHIVFGEAMAILAGDALLTDAFRMFAESAVLPADKLIPGVRELAASAGIKGMVAGQAQDIISENAEPDEKTVQFIHRNKTAALIGASVTIGGVLAGADDNIPHLAAYGDNIGLAFQVIDDILDIESSTEELGKPSGSDIHKKKMTYPAVYGIERSRETAEELINTAVTAVKKISGKPDMLISIAEYLLTRTK